MDGASAARFIGKLIETQRSKCRLYRFLAWGGFVVALLGLVGSLTKALLDGTGTSGILGFAASGEGVGTILSTFIGGVAALPLKELWTGKERLSALGALREELDRAGTPAAGVPPQDAAEYVNMAKSLFAKALGEA